MAERIEQQDVTSDPAGTAHQPAGSSAAQVKAARKPGHTTSLKEAAAQFGYKAAASIRLWIVNEGAPGSQDSSGQWWVPLEELHKWAIEKGKKVPTLPFRGVATKADESVDEATPPEDLFVAGDGLSIDGQIEQSERALAQLMRQLHRQVVQTDGLNPRAIGDLTGSVKHLSNELRQLKTAREKDLLASGRALLREDADAAMRSIVAAWTDNLVRAEAELSEAIQAAVDRAEADGLDRDQRGRAIARCVADQVEGLRARIAASIESAADSSEPASTPPEEVAA